MAEIEQAAESGINQPGKIVDTLAKVATPCQVQNISRCVLNMFEICSNKFRTRLKHVRETLVFEVCSNRI